MLIYGVSSKKFVAVIFLIVGAVSVLLGLWGEFTFVSCGPGALTCIRVYSLDLLAVTAGTIVTGVGIKLIRELSGSH
ncbi:hypothetical protein E6H27_08595 [Candidatus Bathyarchaeota archaeon]|nr:MAG: hypothetical protein E6H27_08595 [Candidatus Bathyarchaeota archaeon]